MNFSIATFKDLVLEQIWIEFTTEDIETIKASNSESFQEARSSNAFINRLCLHLFTKWMQENLDLKNQPNVFPISDLSPVWEVVNGTGIKIGSKKLVLIPSDIADAEELAVPQEWVDIPNWSADYYLPVRVDLARKYLNIWGFASRKTLKLKGELDPIYRTYYLERNLLIEDLEVLWISCHLCEGEKGQIDSLPTIAEIEAQALIKKLSHPSPYSPRLEVEFSRWGAFLTENRWLQQLYDRRVKVAPAASHAIFKLSNWLDSVVETGWQTIDEFLSHKTLTPAFHSGFRGAQINAIPLNTQEQIQRAICQLYHCQDRVLLPENCTAEDALVHLMQNTKNETIRWQAAEYLWNINPMHPTLPVRRIMDLQVQFHDNCVALMVAVMPKQDGKVAILCRVYPGGDRYCLPAGLQLTGLDEKGNPIPRLEATARSEPLDRSIQLYFSADAGDRFSLRVSFKDAEICEHFIA